MANMEYGHFFENADALIFVVDSQDRARLNKDRAWVRSGGQKVDWGRSAVQQDRPARVDKPARLIIRVLWFLFLIVFVKSEVRKQIGRRWHCLPPTSTSKPADQIMIAVGVAQYFFFFFLPDCWALHRFWHWLVRIRTIGHSPWLDWKWSRDPSWGDIGTMNLGQTKVWHLKLVHRNKTDGEFRDVWYSLLVRLDIFDNEWSWSLVVVVCFVFATGQVGLDILLREDNQANGK